MESVCKGGECQLLGANFRVSVTCTTKALSWLRVGCGTKTENKLVDIQNGAPDLFDDIGEAKMLHNEDKRAFAPREEFGRSWWCDKRDQFFGGEQHIRKVVLACKS